MTDNPANPKSATRPLAVALKYEDGGVPVVVAKGRGAVAQAITKTATDHAVMVEENAILAEALSQVELDAEIPEALYKAVAEVIVFVLRAGRAAS